MKKLLFFLALLFIGCMNLFAQAPASQRLTFQTVVRNAQNQLVIDQSGITVTVDVCNADGSVVKYRETHSGLSTNPNGLLTLMVGSGTPVDGTWDNIDWADASIKTTISYNPGSGTVEITSSPAPVTAVPYALQAGNANATETDPVFTAWDKSYNDLINKPDIPEAQVQSDWNQADDTKVDFIKNKPDLTVYATQSGNNTFAGNNSFTGTNTVPSGFNFSTNSSNCNNVVVNACDLFAVFDSLNRRIQELADEISALKSATPPTATAPSFQNVGATSMTIKANNTSTGADITSYKYCYSTNADMNSATCQTTSTPTLNVTGLTPNTTYYATVEATSLAGSTTSDIANVRTPAHAPTATVTPPTAAKPTAGIKVVVTDIEPQEKDDATTVQVCYKQSSTCTAQENYNDYTCADAQNVASGISTNTQTITGLVESTDYCVIVKVSNGDSTTVYGPYSMNTGENVTMTISGPSDTNRCGTSSVAVPYLATINGDNASDFTYAWSNGGSTTQKDTVSLSATSTINVTATHSTEGYTLTATTSTTVNNNPVSVGLCESEGVVSVKGSPIGNPNNINWGDGSAEESTMNSPHDYTTHLTQGIHTVTFTASNAQGCSYSRTMTVTVLGSGSTAADRTVKPCPAPASHAVQTSGYGNANDGKETAVNDSITSVTDYDGHAYPVVEIGSQCWMAVNLRTTHYASGKAVPAGTTSNNSTTAAYYYDYSSSSIPLEQRGYLYNWTATMDSVTTEGTQGVCPTGWHVPTKDEWSAMVAAADASNSTGSVYLSSSCYWNGSTSGAGSMTPNSYDNPDRNKSYFSGVPAGRFMGASLVYSGEINYFWSSSVASGSNSWYRSLYWSEPNVWETSEGWELGFSVRCVRDADAPLSASINLTGPDDATLCGTSVEAIFTATPSDGGTYTYSWSGTPTTSDNTATYSFTEANTYTVTVTATHTSPDYTLTATKDITVTAGGVAATIAFCEDKNSVTVKNTNCNTFSWKNSSDVQVSTSETGLEMSATIPAGIYTVTGTITGGCSITKQVVLGGITTKPCTAASMGSHEVQTGTDYTGNGFNNANHGLESTDSEGNIISVTDYDGNEYPVVQIGSQCWLAENLRCTHSPKTGSRIVVTNNTRSFGSKQAKWYSNDSATYVAKRFGLLYNWCAVMDTANPGSGVDGGAGTYIEVGTTGSGNNNKFLFEAPSNHQGICPTGWHVPTDAEWNTMEATVSGDDWQPDYSTDYLTYSGDNGYRGNHAGKLVSSCDWSDYNVDQNETDAKPGNYAYQYRNYSGFSAVPCEYNNYGEGTWVYFWSSSNNGAGSSYYRGINKGEERVVRWTEYTDNRNSLRCVRD